MNEINEQLISNNNIAFSEQNKEYKQTIESYLKSQNIFEENKSTIEEIPNKEFHEVKNGVKQPKEEVQKVVENVVQQVINKDENKNNIV